jgi:hypothetical protein
MAAKTVLAISAEEAAASRNNTMPQLAGKLAWNARSPKSLSKVSKTRRSRMAQARTCGSAKPGGFRSDPGDIVAGVSQTFDGIQRKVLIRQEGHLAPQAT